MERFFPPGLSHNPNIAGIYNVGTLVKFAEKSYGWSRRKVRREDRRVYRKDKGAKLQRHNRQLARAVASGQWER